MANAKAVLLSDVHYDIPTLKVADAATNQAIDKANELNVPLIIAGDLHNSKAQMRAECVNRMRETFARAKTTVYILVGNHDLINEKAKEHALNFLNREPYNEGAIFDDTSAILIIDGCYTVEDFHINGHYLKFIPYQHDPAEFKKALDKIDKGSTIIMHQGIQSSLAGEYIIDKSAVPKEWLADYRVISGHYHVRQDIKCGRPQKGCVGLASYIGNPYTLNFAEANNPEKGFQILMDDGTLEFVPTNLRKHVVVEMKVGTPMFNYSSIFDTNDLVKVRVSGTREQLAKVTKQSLFDQGFFPPGMDFKLELIPLDSKTETPKNTSNLSQSEVLDQLIDSVSNTTDEQKQRIKNLWKGML